MFKVDDLVTIIVDHPSGIECEDVLNEVGIITEIVNENGRTDILVHTLTNSNDFGWVFGPEELRLATDEEVREKLQYELRKYHAI